MKKEIPDSIIIEAELISETDKAWYLNCEGDKAWFPKSQVNFDNEAKELEAPRRLLKEKFPKEQF